MDFEPRSCIYPLFKAKHKDGDVEDLEFLGTCFFVQIDKWIVIVTANHNIKIPLAPDEIYAISERIGNEPNVVGIKGDFGKVNGDISFLRFIPNSLVLFKKPMQPLRVLTKKLRMGQDVFSYGFPFTQKIPKTSTEPITIWENNLFQKGYINSIASKESLPDFVTEAFEINYYLSFFVPEGMSGAPLLVTTKDGVFAAGLVYGNHEIKYLVSSWEESENEEKTEKHVNYRQYGFGISSTFLPFEEIKNTLTDIEKRERNK